jgi:hypothetical protein
MILIAGGDSFIFGNELGDYHDLLSSRRTFPALLAKEHQLEYYCSAWPGNANNAITRMTIAGCEQNKSKNPIAVVTWTFLERYEFHFTYHTKQRLRNWQSVNSWTPSNITKDDLRKKFINNNEEILELQMQNLKTAQETGTADFAKEFFKHVGSNEYYELYHSLKEFVFLQNYFKVNRIPYLMLTADNHFYEHPNFKRSQDIYLNNLYDQIDWTNWYFFPEGNGANQTTTPRGFYQWAMENKYPVGTTHPLEEAHAAAANLIKEKFNELVTKSLEQNSIRN